MVNYMLQFLNLIIQLLTSLRITILSIQNTTTVQTINYAFADRYPANRDHDVTNKLSE